MIDTREPRNGDFARYVETLAHLPGERRAAEPERPAAGAERSERHRRAQGPTADSIGRLFGTVSVVLTVAGLALIVLSASGEAPFVNPVLGFGLIVAGAVMNRVSRRLR